MRLPQLPETIILAGGLGSRLRQITSRVPKPMVEINGKPFLAYLFDFLAAQGVVNIVLSVGYRAETIIGYFQDKYGNMQIKYAIEDRPLGTGGAIRNALHSVNNERVFVMNGDTYFSISLSKLLDFHESRSSNISIALKYMRNAERYGKISVDAEHKIVSMQEKGHKGPGLINGGIYLVCRDVFNGIALPDVFSFELDFLAKYHHYKATYGLPFEDYFVDIGVPRDYERAKSELKRLGD